MLAKVTAAARHAQPAPKTRDSREFAPMLAQLLAALTSGNPVTPAPAPSDKPVPLAAAAGCSAAEPAADPRINDSPENPPSAEAETEAVEVVVSDESAETPIDDAPQDAPPGVPPAESRPEDSASEASPPEASAPEDMIESAALVDLEDGFDLAHDVNLPPTDEPSGEIPPVAPADETLAASATPPQIPARPHASPPGDEVPVADEPIIEAAAEPEPPVEVPTAELPATEPSDDDPPRDAPLAIPAPGNDDGEQEVVSAEVPEAVEAAIPPATEVAAPPAEIIDRQRPESVPAQAEPARAVQVAVQAIVAAVHEHVDARPQVRRAEAVQPATEIVARSVNAGGEAPRRALDLSARSEPRVSLSRDTLERVKSAIKTLALRGGDEGEARIALSPPSLGHLRVTLRLRDGEMTAQLVADNPALRQMLQPHIPELTGALAEHGLTLGGFDVSTSGHERRPSAPRATIRAAEPEAYPRREIAAVRQGRVSGYM